MLERVVWSPGRAHLKATSAEPGSRSCAGRWLSSCRDSGIVCRLDLNQSLHNYLALSGRAGGAWPREPRVGRNGDAVDYVR